MGPALPSADVLCNVSFYAERPGRSTEMARRDDPEGSPDPAEEELREVVPARAVLTELARGFLLVHETNPARAVRFAETFLRERSGRPAEPRVESVPHVTLARLSLGRSPRGAVEPFGLASSGWSGSE